MNRCSVGKWMRALVCSVGFCGSLMAGTGLYDFDDQMDLASLQELEIRSGAKNDAAAMERPYVIMVSLDGFRYDYPSLHGAEELQDMMEKGSYITRLIPSFPSKTFPNHYTLATGMYPANHGLVGNSFFSRSLNESYRLGKRDAVEDGKWYGGTPLWVLAEQSGTCSASFFWVGSEADVQGTHPSYYFKYKQSTPYALRVEKVKQWLELPEAARPHLIMLYYSLTDSAGHAYGPEAPETGEAVRYVDGMIGKLRDYIAGSELPINLIVTADHGMTETTRDINVRDFADLGESRFVSGPMAMIYTDSEEETQRIYGDLQRQKVFDVYLQGALPSYLNFSNADRIGDIVLIAEAPDHLDYWTEEKPKSYAAVATHGYDPYRCKDMGAIFIAEGPGVRSGQVLSPVENVHVYPFVANLLGLQIPEGIDGKPERLQPLLK